MQNVFIHARLYKRLSSYKRNKVGVREARENPEGNIFKAP